MTALLGLVAGYGLSLGVIGGLLVSVATYLALMNLGSYTARRGDDWRQDAALVLAVHLTFFGLLRFGVAGALLALSYVPLRYALARVRRHD